MRANLMGLRVGVLMGGPSHEREISLRSGERVLESLHRQGFDAVGIAVDEDLVERLRREKIDIAFVVLHGRYGEDGCVQGLLEIMRIPYTGSGVTASALAMNKVATKRVLAAVGIATARFELVDIERGVDLEIERLVERLGLPLVVKPLQEGSSIGVEIADGADQLNQLIRRSVYDFGKIYCEAFIPGRELTVGVLGTNGSARALPVLELKPKRRFYDYHAKYTQGLTEFVVPAPLSPQLTEAVQQSALAAHRALGCAGMSRVDMILAEGDVPTVLEVNTIPGFTATSDLPAQAAAAGISFDDLVFEVLKAAWVVSHPERTNQRHSPTPPALPDSAPALRLASGS
jgi:D-alanine-D-alanine ligase